MKHSMLALISFFIILGGCGIWLLYNRYCWENLCIYPEKSLVVVIPSYNNARWYQKNLASVFAQKYDNYRVIYIDDCSTDQTADLVQSYVNIMHQAHRVSIIRNMCHKGVLANVRSAINTCKNDEIIIDLDGDDWLKHDLVFKKINALYNDADVWMTYGQYETYPVGNKGICRAIPDWVIEHHAYRAYPWVTSHLRTFYAGLFKLIKTEDCYYGDNFYQVGNDQLFMLCMLEMAGYHSRFVPEVLYVYNTINILNEFRIHRDLEKSVYNNIRQKMAYIRLDDGCAPYHVSGN